ncbi:uncharacterized protein (DUF302 family) [Nocardia transvalensis]|uniref:Uncharacterized protein (DUF302 family) n=1 Tax=Nocardia transvalensis TaxID=37333 RepID=A0A7W9ULH7_9NOCA|nr:GyrI-like domain-containing protein [Nocardia transvalensis]MBB5916710.1 uncharacterized protein (DUF302 family) [Nocardia transvalensis]
MEYRVNVCETVPQAVLRMPREVRQGRLGEDVAEGMRDLMATVQRAGLTSIGAPSLTFLEEGPAHETTVVDFRVPVEPAPMLSLRSGAEVVVCAGDLVARTSHRGGYGGLPDAYRALREWMTESGYRASGPPSEVYLVGPDEVTEPRRLITELRIPVLPPPAIGVYVRQRFAETLERVRETLRQRGFSALGEIDMHAVSRRADVEQYLILCLYHPALASRAIASDPPAGLLLPCTVVVRATDGGTRVEAGDPMLYARATGQEALQPIAGEIHRLLTAALDAVRADAGRERPKSHGTAAKGPAEEYAADGP